MLSALFRLSASIRSPPLPQAATLLTRFPTLIPLRPARCIHLPALRRASSLVMFKQAVKNHNAAVSLPQNNGVKQQSLGNSFKRSMSTTTSPKTSTAHPLTLGSGNTARHNSAAERRPPGQVHGIKRTSGGLAKALGSQEDMFNYPPLNIGDMENELPRSFHNVSQGNPAVQSPVYFDEGDFDSDLDLDFEDPSTKDTVTYSAATPVSNGTTKASMFKSDKQDPIEIPEEDSSQPIPWSSSPISHFRTPVRAVVQPPKRRTLPWNQSQNKPQFQPASKLEATLEAAPEYDFDIDEREEEVTPRPKKRKSTEAKPVPVQSTPVQSNSAKTQFPWNTTASALKEKQKNLREQNKKITTMKAEGTGEEVKKAATKKKKNSVHRIFLSEEQQNVLNLVVEYKKSVFFTGSAGTGKSVLLREIIAALRRKYIKEPDRVAVVASTGLAACNIGGVTIHRFAGIGLGKEPAEELIKKIRRNPKAKQRWLRTKVLVIDEVSMVDGDLYDKLEQIARTLRNNGRPFGGIQLVITGDFFQLPPVPDHSGRTSKFAFDAGTWTTSIEHTIGLHHVFRQKDPVFANMLNEMREGRMSANSIAQFKKLDRPLPPSDDNIEATELFPTRQEVDRANNLRMQQLHGSVFSFEARDGGSITNKEQRDKLLESCMVPEVVHLKKGAQVMLVKNMDDTLVNGSLGKVTSFMTEEMFTLYKEDEEAFLDQNATEGEGAENRMKQQMLKATLGLNTAKVYPVVRFAIQDGTTRDLLCKPETWKIEQPNGQNPDVLASRDQIPLILSWALSIHKAQGQTLERVRVDLGKVFEKGQAYVALSRATSMAGLQVMRFDHRKVLAHEKVRQFYSSLSRAEQVQGKEKSKTVLGKMMVAGKKGKQNE